ncbi:MAG: DUF255 domain-containing protein [Arenicellales bacterium]|nr:DUF255 domain-containing protein [Arenicellales bacterium]
MFHKRLRLLVLTLCVCCGSASALDNQLQNHPSPYLALHGNDPVAWQDWTQAAVQLAKDQGKLLYVSVGYFSCHWCHVMQRESYQNDQIAMLLNENFIPVKVDRELEPALDARLIEFAQATQGRAGWPLNVFLTPQGHPLYAVLYMPPENFQQVLTRLQEIWQNDSENLSNLAARESRPLQGPGEPKLDVGSVQALAQKIVAEALNIADIMEGGFGQQNKFPMVPQLTFLLDQYELDQNDQLREFLILTLDQMADNGMYDHVGDGFFRYATDPGWEIPHFEKMLYDNALLAMLYLRASSSLDVPRYAQIARNTLDFMQRDMLKDNGAMVASFSAVDENDVEGGYYLWRASELAHVLTEKEAQIIRMAWAMTGPVVFEAGYLPKKGSDVEAIKNELGVTEADVLRHIELARSKLFAARSERILPTDTKLLAGWNGLALAGFARAAKTINDEGYMDSAHKLRNYIMTELWDGVTLRRAVDGQRELGKPSLEDYAYVGMGLWEWAELTGNREDYQAVSDIIEQAWARFYKEGWHMAEESFIAMEPKRDLIADGPMPSPAAVVALLSLKLAERNNDDKLRRRTLSALNSGDRQLKQSGFWYASHVRAMLAAVETN